MTISPANRGCTGVTTQPVRPVKVSAEAAIRMPPEIRRHWDVDVIGALFMCMPFGCRLVGVNGPAEKSTLSIGGVVSRRMTWQAAPCVDCNVRYTSRLLESHRGARAPCLSKGRCRAGWQRATGTHRSSCCARGANPACLQLDHLCVRGHVFELKPVRPIGEQRNDIGEVRGQRDVRWHRRCDRSTEIRNGRFRIHRSRPDQVLADTALAVTPLVRQEPACDEEGRIEVVSADVQDTTTVVNDKVFCAQNGHV